MSIITIVSGIFCSGEEIAKRVADQLEYALVGDELVHEASRRYDTTVRKLTRALAGDRTLFNAVTHDYEKSVGYLKSTLAEKVARDDLVFHGPASHLIPQAIGHVLKVGIIADMDYRINQAAELENLDAGRARRIVEKLDDELASWTQEQLSTSPWDPAIFDIVVPLPGTTIEQAVDLIRESLTRDALRATDRSIRAALDFLLATRVNLALLEGGLYNCDVTASQGKVKVVLNQKAAPAGKLGRTVYALRQERSEDEALRICKGVEGVTDVEVKLGSRVPKTLLVDDEQEFVMTLSERLQMRDIQSDVVFDGSQALEFVSKEEPEVMILDLKMPGIDGIEVLRRIKRDHPAVEVIVLTGHGTEKDEQAARQLGAFDYLQKPVDISVLEERIKAASGRDKSTEQEDPDDDHR